MSDRPKWLDDLIQIETTHRQAIIIKSRNVGMLNILEELRECRKDGTIPDGLEDHEDSDINLDDYDNAWVMALAVGCPHCGSSFPCGTCSFTRVANRLYGVIEKKEIHMFSCCNRFRFDGLLYKDVTFEPSSNDVKLYSIVLFNHMAYVIASFDVPNSKVADDKSYDNVARYLNAHIRWAEEVLSMPDIANKETV